MHTGESYITRQMITADGSVWRHKDRVFYNNLEDYTPANLADTIRRVPLRETYMVAFFKQDVRNIRIYAEKHPVRLFPRSAGGTEHPRFARFGSWDLELSDALSQQKGAQELLHLFAHAFYRIRCERGEYEPLIAAEVERFAKQEPQCMHRIYLQAQPSLFAKDELWKQPAQDKARETLAAGLGRNALQNRFTRPQQLRLL